MSEELLDVQPRARWPLGLAAAGAVGLGVLAGFALRGPGGSTPAAAPPPPTVTITASASARPVPNADLDRELALVATEASAPAQPAASAQPFGVCERPASGDQVVSRLAAGIHAVFPHYLLTDATRVTAGSTGLCRVELRAHRRDTVLVVHVVAPLEETRRLDRREDIESAATHGSTTQYVRFSEGDGWIVTVGTCGPSAGAPWPIR